MSDCINSFDAVMVGLCSPRVFVFMYDASLLFYWALYCVSLSFSFSATCLEAFWVVFNISLIFTCFWQNLLSKKSPVGGYILYPDCNFLLIQVIACVNQRDDRVVPVFLSKKSSLVASRNSKLLRPLLFPTFLLFLQSGWNNLIS